MSTTLIVPVMSFFTLPEGATIESTKSEISMSSSCNTNLTTENFGADNQRCGSLQGGFLNIGTSFSSEAGVLVVAQLSKETRRKFRLGTPLESLAYKKANLPHPKWWAVLSKVFSGKVLAWNSWDEGPPFFLNYWRGDWSSNYEVFVVEDSES